MIEGINAEPLVSDNTANQAETLVAGINASGKKAKLTPHLFEEDLVSPDGGDDYLLFQILKNYFVAKKYRETVDKLSQLIGTNISDSTRNRACFYLGEAYYLQGNYEEAVRSFVKVQAAYPTLAKKWLDSSLDRL